MRTDQTRNGGDATGRRGLGPDRSLSAHHRLLRGVLLGAVLAGSLLGAAGCGHRAAAAPAAVSQPPAPIAEFRAVLITLVGDPARLQQMLAFADDAQRAAGAAQAQLEALSAEQDILARDYATSPEALADVSARLQATRATYRTIIIHDRCEIAKLATDHEWNAIADHELGMLK